MEIKINKKAFLACLLLVSLVFAFPSIFPVLASDDEDETLDKIRDAEKDLEKEEAKLQTSQNELYQTQVQINSTTYKINQTEEEIERKEQEIKSIEDRIALNKKILTSYLQKIYFDAQEDPIIVLAIQNNDFSDLVETTDRVLSAGDKINLIMAEIKGDKEELGEAKEELADEKEQHEDLLAVQQAEKGEIVSDINVTKLSISQLQAKLSKLRSTLAKFLGEDFDMDDVIDAVKYADKKTGVRKEFLFAMLDKESDLGRFTGGCYYSKGSNPVKKHMKDADKDAFEDLMDELGYGKNDKKLSCWPGYGYGGAMGIAQFMPTTWNGYKDKIASRTGNKPANPWRLKDGVIGMALKLAAAGADKKSKEHYAAKVYYCGGPSSPYWNNKCEAYADTVVSWAEGYDEYFD